VLEEKPNDLKPYRATTSKILLKNRQHCYHDSYQSTCKKLAIHSSEEMTSVSRSAMGCFRSIGGTVRTAAASSSRRTSSSPFSFSANANAPHRRFSFISRLPVELGCCLESLIPLHNAVASARLTSRLAINSRSLSQ
ncbi:hypothetical protein KI387_042700, partial [Taxus chinensis]